MDLRRRRGAVGVKGTRRWGSWCGKSPVVDVCDRSWRAGDASRKGHQKMAGPPVLRGQCVHAQEISPGQASARHGDPPWLVTVSRKAPLPVYMHHIFRSMEDSTPNEGKDNRAKAAKVGESMLDFSTVAPYGTHRPK